MMLPAHHPAVHAYASDSVPHSTSLLRREVAACDSTRPPQLMHDDVLRRFDELVAASATIKIYVDRTGRVVAADVVSESDDEIGPAVVDALKDEPFRPAECNGRNEAGVYLARINP